MQNTNRKKVRPSTGVTLTEHLAQEIAFIERQISDLEAERDALKRRLTSLSYRVSVNLTVSRKNSADRILIESAILNALNQSSSPLGAYSLSFDAKALNRDLKTATLRSYLHRLKGKGYITSTGRGRWAITPAGKHYIGQLRS